MYQSTASHTTELSNYGLKVISKAIQKPEKPINVNELAFQTELSEHKRLKSPKNGLLFIFNLKDDINCLSPSTGQEFQLGSFQSIMVSSSEHRYIDLVFAGKGNYHLCLLTVSKLESLGNFNADFIQTHFKSQNHYWHTGIPNVKLSNFVHDLMTLNGPFSCNQQMLVGYSNIVIGSKLAEFEHYMNGPKKQVDLRNDEIDRIHECIQFVKDNYAQQLDVDMLCLKSALSPQKLQTGFKELYGDTVTSFIKNFRLQIAEELMRTTELNVSQIVYSIGLTSRSYFSKIFREKYETSPNDYMKKFKHQVA